MRVLVTGGGGFVGGHLIRELISHGHEPIAFDLSFAASRSDSIITSTGDIRSSQDANDVVSSSKCDACIHLGAISFVPAGNSDPAAMFAVNVMGTLNLLEAFRKHSSKAIILTASTAHIYDAASARTPIKEDSCIAPVSMYAISKAAADLSTLAYARHYDMHTMCARPNNHVGPGQSPQFVVASFAAQLKAISAGKSEPVLKAGNLDSVRDITDVRDVVRAYRLLIEKGHAGEAYNISSLNVMTIRDVLNKLCDIAGVTPKIVVDPKKYRPTDRSPVLDIGKLQEHTAWKPEIDISVTLKDVLSAA